MSGLVLKLNPFERVLVNGAVIENGNRRSKLSIVTPNANILRLRDAIRPEQANTPVSRVCYVAQLLLSGDADERQGHDQLIQGIDQLSFALIDDDSQLDLKIARDATIEGDFYKALKALRRLLPIEKTLMIGRAS